MAEVSKNVPAVVQWLIEQGIDPNEARAVERHIDPMKARLIRQQRGLEEVRRRKNRKHQKR